MAASCSTAAGSRAPSCSASAGFDFRDSPSAIFPILGGSDEEALPFARGCQRRGVFVQAVITPVVPAGQARLRAVVTAGHRKEDLDWALRMLQEAAAEAHVPLAARRAS